MSKGFTVETIALAAPILAGLGFAGDRLATIETDDPFALGAALRAIEPGAAARKLCAQFPRALRPTPAAPTPPSDEIKQPWWKRIRKMN